MSGLLFQDKREDNTQAGGAFTVTTPADALEHQIAIETTGSPTAGTLQVGGKPLDGTVFRDLGAALDMVNGPYIVRIQGHFKELEFTPTGFNGTDYDVIISSHK